MPSSDNIALLALSVSLISFWLSYRSTRLSKLLSAAEKKSQACIILLETLLHAQMMHSIYMDVQVRMRTISNLPTKDKNQKHIRMEISRIMDEQEVEYKHLLQVMEDNLKWLRSANINDPVALEKFKLLASEKNLHMEHLSLKLSSLEKLMTEMEMCSTKLSESSILLPD